TSSGSSVRKYSAVRRRLSRRPDVAASLRHSSANSENGRTRSLCAGEEDHHRRPRRGARERDERSRELTSDLNAPHVLSGSQQKKGARPAVGNEVLIRRDVNHLPLLMRLGSTGGGGWSPGLRQKPRRTPTTLPRTRTSRSRGSTTMGAIVG